MEYNIFQHQDQTNFEGLHAQEYTHTWMILQIICVQIRKKNQPTDPPNFQAKRANKPFIF